jgi:hypothetical protein
MASQSQFSKLSKKQLVFICEKLVDDEFPIGNPYEQDFDHAYNTLKDVSKYFNIEPAHEDVEFFSKLLEINGEIIGDFFANNREEMRNKELIGQLVLPVSKTYDLHYTTNGTCNFEEFMGQYFDCYDKDWVRDSAEQQRQDGNWDLYDGRNLRETEYDSYEINDESYGHVYEVTEEYIKDGFVNESILDRIVLENTKDVVNSLDKKTLLKLRTIIESRLRSL